MIDLSYQFVNVQKSFKAIADKYKTQEMCERAFKVDPCSLDMPLTVLKLNTWATRQCSRDQTY